MRAAGFVDFVVALAGAFFVVFEAAGAAVFFGVPVTVCTVTVSG